LGTAKCWSFSKTGRGLDIFGVACSYLATAEHIFRRISREGNAFQL
jgi:hypothetical protein